MPRPLSPWPAPPNSDLKERALLHLSPGKNTMDTDPPTYVLAGNRMYPSGCQRCKVSGGWEPPGCLSFATPPDEAAAQSLKNVACPDDPGNTMRLVIGGNLDDGVKCGADILILQGGASISDSMVQDCVSRGKDKGYEFGFAQPISEKDIGMTTLIYYKEMPGLETRVPLSHGGRKTGTVAVANIVDKRARLQQAERLRIILTARLGEGAFTTNHRNITVCNFQVGDENIGPEHRRQLKEKQAREVTDLVKGSVKGRMAFLLSTDDDEDLVALAERLARLYGLVTLRCGSQVFTVAPAFRTLLDLITVCEDGSIVLDLSRHGVQGAWGTFCQLEDNKFGFGTVTRGDYGGRITQHLHGVVDVGDILCREATQPLRFPVNGSKNIKVPSDWDELKTSMDAITGSSCLCVDLEWGDSGKIRLICIGAQQNPVASDSDQESTWKVHVLDLKLLDKFGRALRFFLSHEFSTKVVYGFDFREDEKKLKDEGFLCEEGIIRKQDMRSCLNRFIPEAYTTLTQNEGYVTKFGLADILRIACGLKLNKELQTSNWDADLLEQKQIEYAALDVYALVKLVEYFRIADSPRDEPE